MMKTSNSKAPFVFQNRELVAAMVNEGVENAARGMSGMVGETLCITRPAITYVPLVEVPSLLGSPEIEAVGIYLRTAGSLASQFMIVIPYYYALELVDAMLGEPIGTTQRLDTLECSALAELGNMTGSYFLNAVASLTGVEALPSPPAVMVDMVGAILNIILANCNCGAADKVLMIQATFQRGERAAPVEFWVFPDHSVLGISPEQE